MTKEYRIDHIILGQKRDEAYATWNRALTVAADNHQRAIQAADQKLNETMTMLERELNG